MLPPAAQFIVNRIVEQAAIENITMSKVERDILLFSETSPTLPNIAEVNEVFERDYDHVDYEEKIRNLIRKIDSAAQMDLYANRAWKQAVRSLRGKDYYVLVMLNESGRNGRPRGDLLRLIGAALLIVAVIVGAAFFFAR